MNLPRPPRIPGYTLRVRNYREGTRYQQNCPDAGRMPELMSEERERQSQWNAHRDEKKEPLTLVEPGRLKCSDGRHCVIFKPIHLITRSQVFFLTTTKSTDQAVVVQTHTCCLVLSPPCCHRQHPSRTGRNVPETPVTPMPMVKGRWWCSRRCLSRGCRCRLRCQQPILSFEQSSM